MSGFEDKSSKLYFPRVCCCSTLSFVRRLIPQRLRSSLRNSGISPGGAVCGSHPPSLPHPPHSSHILLFVVPEVLYISCWAFFFFLHLHVAQYPVWIIKLIFSVQVGTASWHHTPLIVVSDIPWMRFQLLHTSIQTLFWTIRSERIKPCFCFKLLPWWQSMKCSFVSDPKQSIIFIPSHAGRLVVLPALLWTEFRVFELTFLKARQ